MVGNKIRVEYYAASLFLDDVFVKRTTLFQNKVKKKFTSWYSLGILHTCAISISSKFIKLVFLHFLRSICTINTPFNYYFKEEIRCITILKINSFRLLIDPNGGDWTVVVGLHYIKNKNTINGLCLGVLLATRA